MQKNFDHALVENKLYKAWEESGAFRPVSQWVSETVGQLATDKPTTASPSHRPPFSIIMPPPNANDSLHVGHAMFISLEDILIRYHRMLGDDTVWIPGTDHAGIETQFLFEKKLAKTGQSRFQFDRETLYKMIWDYVQENSGIAIDQMKKLGASADWSRYKFTLDDDVVDFVTATFQKLHHDQLVYRDLQLVNFCTKCGTSYSELEVNHKEQQSTLYYVRYPLVDNPEEFVVVATTRPEPIFADQFLAVHPEDESKKHLIGKFVHNPLTNEKMEIIADRFVDPEFGTGFVKLTPAHDYNDFEVAQRHNIPLVSAIGIDGKLLANAGEFAGLKVAVARERIVEFLQVHDRIEKIDTKYTNRVGTCYRCGRVIEILPLPQFFLKVKNPTNNLVEKTIAILDEGQTKIHGAGREKILRHWLDNLKDWNISRQIVWGIRIPVWYSIEENPMMHVVFLDKQGEKQHGIINELLTKYPFEEIEAGLQSLNAPEGAKYVVSRQKPAGQQVSPSATLRTGGSVVSSRVTKSKSQISNSKQNSNSKFQIPNSDSPGNQGTEELRNYLQETDTFDTWFSSAQWPVVTLQTENGIWKMENGETQQLKTDNRQTDPLTHRGTEDPRNQGTDFQRFYPTSVMETSYDILLFWVMRMMFMGVYLTDQTPFKDVYLHGLVRDEKGLKMSKSKGNVVNPIIYVEKYGADALRMALVMSSTPGNDSAVGEPKIKGMRNFSNKIWNAARFVLTNRENTKSETLNSKQIQNSKFSAQGGSALGGKIRNVSSHPTNHKSPITKHLSDIVSQVTDHLDALRIGLAAEVAHNEFWHWYCDEVIEQAKTGEVSQEELVEGLITFLKLLHPFVPFVTEAVWQELWKQNDPTIREMMGSELLIRAEWPRGSSSSVGR